MLEFLLYLLSGFGYALYLDLNPVEALLVGVTLLCAFRGWMPRIRLDGAGRAFTAFARRRRTAVATVFLLALTFRLALLPWQPVPKPFVSDEFSHLLLADTLKHGRLSNPTHPLWVHFESIHIIQKPTYNSDYFPGQGAVLALGKLAGHPWIAVLVLCAAMCAAICWMLQAWLPPAWALFGALVAILRFGIASYWIDGYYGGCLAATGGALALGAYPRLLRKPSAGTSLLFGLGITIIGYSRPFEGLAVAVPAAAAIGLAVWRKRISWAWCLPPTAVVMAGIAGLLIYCQAVTGDPFRPPYAVNQVTYGWPMTLPWFHPPPQPEFHHQELRRYYEYEKEVHDRGSSVAGAFKLTTLKAQEIWRFYFGPALTIPLAMLPRVWRSRRLRLLLIVSASTIAAALIEVGNSPHYTACATAGFLAVLVECCRRLRLYRYRERPVGAQLLAAAPVIVVAILTLRITLENLNLPFTQPVDYQSWCCVRPGNPNKPRIAAMLDKIPGRHLVLVKPKDDPLNVFQWIYNDADIDSERVVWARDMGVEGNKDLVRYFQGRRMWLVDPNVDPATIAPLEP